MRGRQLEQLFGDEPIVDIPLANAPLVRVLCQLRFDRLSMLSSPEATQRFIALLSDAYPYSEQKTQLGILLGDDEISTKQTAELVWNLKSEDKADTVSLANGSLAFETTIYRGHVDFCDKVAFAASCLQRVARVPRYNRVGVRFTNQIRGVDTLSNLPALVRPELLGIATVQVPSPIALVHSLTQVMFETSAKSGLLAQYGFMPPSSGFDPSLPFIPEPTWILDLDSFKETETKADQHEILGAMEDLAQRAYRFFRWAVTEEFLSLYEKAKT